MSLAEVTAALRDPAVAARRRDDFLRELKLSGLPSREDIEAGLQAKLEVPQTLPRSWLPLYQACVGARWSISLRRSWDYEIDVRQLLHMEPSAPTTTLEFETAGLDGEIVGYREVRMRISGPR